MVIFCRQDEGEEWWALIWNGRKISCDVRGNQKRIMMHVWSLVSSEKWIFKGKWRFHPRIWRSRSSKDGCLMILSHCRWTAMAVMNIALWWQWTLMAVMTLYKRTSKLQRWWTTLAMMNSIDEPTSFNGGELLRQLWTCLFQWEFALRHKTPKKWLPMSVTNSPPKNAQKDSLCRWWSLLSRNARKSFSVGDEVSVFSASKVSGTTTVTPFPVWCASLNKKIPVPETSPKTAS